MENNLKFRNHASVILENSLKTIGTIVAIFFFNLISDVGEEGITAVDILILVGIFVAVLGIAVGIQAFIWAKTYIIIEENTLVVERNTLNKNRNTIGLKNVSNVNLEQNLFEMIIGTCKVKLDTNSLSTADETDVNIILKKADAENFRRIVLAKSEGQDVPLTGDGLLIADVKTVETTQNAETVEESNTLIGDLGDIILHGLFSIRITSIIILAIVVIIPTVLITDLGTINLGETLIEMIANFVTAFWLAGTAIWSIVKEFVKYLNFRIERKKDKVYLSYGLFKKVAYSVPVDKINGIKLTQTPIARMAKRYMVEIVNVGMDDDENETNTFFLPYAKMETIKEQLHMLLPEFDGALEIKEEKQPVAIWLLSIPWWILYTIIMAVIYFAFITCAEDPETRFAMGFGVNFATVAIALWYMVCKLAGFLTKGIKVDEKFLKIVGGAFAKHTLFVKYDKIQYVTGRQCIIAKHFKIQKGTISLLASLKNRIHELPYFKENDMEVLKNKLI